MMGRRLPVKNDAITRWRFVLAWSHIRRSYWKRTMRRRERYTAKREIREWRNARMTRQAT